MKRIIEEKLNVKMIMQGRVDSADYEMYKKLKEAGTILIMFGIESVNQDVLDFYNKGITLKQINAAITLTNDLGILSFGYFMFGAPIETAKHIENTKKFFDETKLDIMILSILSYCKGSELWEEAVKKGLISKSSFWVSANERLSNYSFKELSAIVDDLTKHFYSAKRILHLLYKFVRLGAAPVVIKGIINGSFMRLVNFTRHPYINFKEDYSK